jgi:hypothetical protein
MKTPRTVKMVDSNQIAELIMWTEDNPNRSYDNALLFQIGSLHPKDHDLPLLMMKQPRPSAEIGFVPKQFYDAE